MKRLNLTLIIWLILNAAWAYAASSALPAKPPAIPDLEPITQNDRILILAPHPDDEAIACAGLIQNAVAAGAQVHVVYLTNGDSNQLAFIIYEKRLTFRKGEFIHMGEVRRAEAVKAMQSLGLKESDLTFLGYPDFGSFAIFTSHWQGAKPFKSLLTRVTSVPYKTNLSFGAPYKGESVLKDLESLIRKYQPSKIFVSHPADTNADHKALYLFLQVALSDLSGKFPEPKVYPYLVHCVKWPSPRRYHPELWLSPPEQLMDSQVKWFRYILSRQQLDKKHKTILLYKSQTESSAFYLLAFARGNELFGDYPSVELKLPDVTSGAGAVNKPPPFLGLSNIYRDAEVSSLANLDRIIAASGSVSYALENGCLLIRVSKGKELNHRLGLVLYIFGYRKDVPFATMPKIRIIAKHNFIGVFDAGRRIKTDAVAMDFQETEVTLKVPLNMLGEPDFVLTATKTYSGVLPVGAVGFRKINIGR